MSLRRTRDLYVPSITFRLRPEVIDPRAFAEAVMTSTPLPQKEAGEKRDEEEEAKEDPEEEEEPILENQLQLAVEVCAAATGIGFRQSGGFVFTTLTCVFGFVFSRVLIGALVVCRC